MELPRGIGLVRVDLPGMAFVAVSDRLTDAETRAARAMAYVLSKKGEHIVVLRETTIAEAAAA